MADETGASKAVLDDTDRQLLQALAEDARASHREIAARTGISPATVNRRLRNLEQNGTVRGFTPILDAEALGWGLSVIIGLRIEKGYLRIVQEDIARDDRVFAVYDVTGEWDGIVLARCRDRADLDDLAKTTLSHDHIQRTNTMVVLKTVKESPTTSPP